MPLVDISSPPRFSLLLGNQNGLTGSDPNRILEERDLALSILESERNNGKPSQADSLTWRTFAGPYADSFDQGIRTTRTNFNSFLSQVSNIVGSDSSSDEITSSALVLYIHTCNFLKEVQDKEGSASAPLKKWEKEAIEKKALQDITRDTFTSVSPKDFQSLVEKVKILEEWRADRKNLQALQLPDYDVRNTPAANVSATVKASDSEIEEAISAATLALSKSTMHCMPLDSVTSSNQFSNTIMHPFMVLRPYVGESASVEDLSYDSVDDEELWASAAADMSRSGATGGVPSLLRVQEDSGKIDAAWLYNMVEAFIVQSGSDLTPEYLGKSILELMKKHKGDEGALQGSLFDLLGESGFEFLATLVPHTIALAAIPIQDYTRVCNVVAASGSILQGGGRSGVSRGVTPGIASGVTVLRDSEIQEEKRRRKEERKLQKALRSAIDIGLDPFAAAHSAATSGASHGGDRLASVGFDPAYIEMERRLGLKARQEDTLYGGTKHLSTAAHLQDQLRQEREESGLLSIEDVLMGMNVGQGRIQKTALPVGTEEKTGLHYKEYSVPPSKPDDANWDPSRLVKISSLDSIAQKAFQGMKSLNRLQSELYEAAYKTNENLLVCAPTGAGKTNVAMLTVCHEILKHVDPDGMTINKENFKIIYVAPMKALAQEVVAKFSERLGGLGISVRELTGDMQMTRHEIANTQIIVTTPEKWDVITRKAGDNTLVALVRLLIIDEVHLLADSRGAVIESIVARTLRHVETSQSVIRIVGLSATLPNYKDVAIFLRVNPTKGLFYFNDAYRPVPLRQTFIGISEQNAIRRLNLMTKHAWDKAIAAIRRGKQVMVFVHSRKDTGKTARALQQLAVEEGAVNILSPFSPEEAEDVDNPLLKSGTGGSSTIQGEGRMSLTEHQWRNLQNEVEKSRNQELRELFPSGFGIHHAGMIRSDRLLSEKLFAAGAIKILVCTATLAWGVNLPAHTVIIKGTQIYNAEVGGFTDLGMLDVMQIFGRAGRPQFDTSGEGIIITSHDKLAHYLSLLTATVPIESTFINALPDHLNAEVVSGTVTNIQEAVTWLSYTYLYVRMLRNPIVYGISWEDLEKDPMLDGKRLELIIQASKRLDECRMVRFDQVTGNLAVTDIGRVASHYYVVNNSIETFNNFIETEGYTHSDEQVFSLVCSAHEFEQVKVREEEAGELGFLKDSVLLSDNIDVSTSRGKVVTLLQAYLMGIGLHSFTLISDTAYIQQSAGRIARALFEIALRKGYSFLAERLLALSNAIDKRLWWTVSPLRQFPSMNISGETLLRIEESGYDISELAQMSAGEIGDIIRHPKMGSRILSQIRQVPSLELDISVQPITRGVIRVSIEVWAAYQWVDRIHGMADPWWIWVEDSDSERIYHSEYIQIQRKQAMNGEALVLVFAVPVFDPLPAQYWVRCVSDRWLGCESVHEINLRNLKLPEKTIEHTELLNLMPLPISALNNPLQESLYNKHFSHFNPVQTQIFFPMLHSDVNILVGAPTGSGKTITAELSLFRLWKAHPGKKAVYIAPLKALVSERVKDWSKKFAGHEKLVVELTGDVTPDSRVLKKADIIITTPEKWDAVTRSWRRRNFVRDVGLVIMDEIHLLGEERGPILEVIVSRLRLIAEHMNVEAAQRHRLRLQNLYTELSKAKVPQEEIEVKLTKEQAPEDTIVRFVGLSTALANANDLADWLGIPPVGLFNFKPAVRPIPMEVHIQGFQGKHYCPRMATMNKPAFAAIKSYSPTKPVLIFVASRRQTRITALELIALCAGDEEPKRFLHASEDELEDILANVHSPELQHTLSFGIGIHHAGLSQGDRDIVEHLFCTGKTQVLICTTTLAWGVNFPAHLVIVKGTEYYDAKTKRYVDFPLTDVLQMIGRAGRPQFDTRGVALILVHEPKKNFYRKFLYESFPVESQLLGRRQVSVATSLTNASTAPPVNVQNKLKKEQEEEQTISCTLKDNSNKSFQQVSGEDTKSRESFMPPSGDLADHFNAEIANGTITSRIDAVEYLTWTYFYRRLMQNPSYYGLHDTRPEKVSEFLYRIVDYSFSSLEQAGCVVRGADAVNILSESDVLGTSYTTMKKTEANKSLPGKSGKNEKGTIEAVEDAMLNHINPDDPFQLPDSESGPERVLVHRKLPDTKDAVAPTPLGRICSIFYLKHPSALLLSRGLDDAWTYPELLKLICDTQEFAEVPVRHNEENLNSDLAKIVPWDIDANDLSDFESSHMKTYLLLIARMARTPLPIPDYINDTKTVLDSAVRVLGATMSISFQKRNLVPTLRLATITQCLVQCVLPGFSPLLQLPYITQKEVDLLTQAFGQVIDENEPAAKELLDNEKNAKKIHPLHQRRHLRKSVVKATVGIAEVAAQSEGAIRSVLSQQNALTSAQINEFLSVLQRLPLANVGWTVSSEGSRPDTLEHSIVTDKSGKKRTNLPRVGETRDRAIRLKKGTSATITVYLNVDGPAGLAKNKIAYVPRYPKEREYTWWVMLGKIDDSVVDADITRIQPAETSKKSIVGLLYTPGAYKAHRILKQGVFDDLRDANEDGEARFISGGHRSNSPQVCSSKGDKASRNEATDGQFKDNQTDSSVVTDGELLGMQRVTAFGHKPAPVNVKFEVPKVPGLYCFQVYLVSEIIHGLDQQYPLWVRVTE